MQTHIEQVLLSPQETEVTLDAKTSVPGGIYAGKPQNRSLRWRFKENNDGDIHHSVFISQKASRWK